MEFARTAAGAALPSNTLALTATGTYTFFVRAGIFNLAGQGSGQSNQGLNNWTATATTTGLAAGETLGVNTANSRQIPFDFGPATSFGGTLVPPGTINNINAARDVSGGAAALWTFNTTTGAPNAQPTAPNNSSLGTFAPVGISSTTNVYRFTVVVNTLAAPNIVINFAGSAGPVLQWSVFGSQVPFFDDNDGDGVFGPGDTPHDGNVHFIGLTPNPVLAAYQPTTLTLTRVPAPGAAALLGLGGLLVARRRR
jgi:hypothetical protein